MNTLVITFVFLLSINVQAFDAGKFFEKTCTQCHTIGGGDKIGPDLAGLSKRRKVDWIVKFVNYPDGMINGDEDENDKDPLKNYTVPDKAANHVYAVYKPQVMAEQEVTKAQVEAVLKYIDSKKKQPKGKVVTEFGKDGLLKKSSKFYSKLPKKFQ